MITSGVSIVAADGLHDDGWCWPQVKFRIRAEAAASEFRVGIWLKPEEDGPSRTLFTFGPENSVAKAEFVPLDQPVDLSIPVSLKAGDEIGIRISTPHRASRGEDSRDLSFIMSSAVLV